jgi:hypothetical protein
VYFPGGVADPDLRAGYVGDTTGIVSVALSHGQQLWRTTRVDRPLISDGVRVAAASLGGEGANTLVVVVLDARQGGDPKVVSDPVVLPAWAAPVMPGGEGFRVSARVDGDSLRLDWVARAAYQGGAPPPAYVERETSRSAAGAVRVDLASGAISPLPAEEAASDAPRPPLGRDDLADPWQAGSVMARLEWEVDGRGQVLILEIGGAAEDEPVKSVELARGEGLVADITPNGLHVLVHAEAQPGDAQGDWLVFSARTGERVATLEHDNGAHSPAILQEHAFYLVDRAEDGTTARTLRARALADGALAWELPLATEERTAAPRPRV